MSSVPTERGHFSKEQIANYHALVREMQARENSKSFAQSISEIPQNISSTYRYVRDDGLLSRFIFLFAGVVITGLGAEYLHRFHFPLHGKIVIYSSLSICAGMALYPEFTKYVIAFPAKCCLYPRRAYEDVAKIVNSCISYWKNPEVGEQFFVISTWISLFAVAYFCCTTRFLPYQRFIGASVSFVVSCCCCAEIKNYR